MKGTTLLKSMVALIVFAAAAAQPCCGDPPVPVDRGSVADLRSADVPNGPLPVPRVESCSNSGCLLDAGGEIEFPCGEDEFDFTVEGTTLHVLHGNATYNCCLDDIVISLSIEENVLVLTEEEILTEPCDCWCCYEANADVVNLAPGTYTVEFRWFDYETWQPQCYADEIVVPAATGPLGDDPPRRDPPVVIDPGSAELKPSQALEAGEGLRPTPRVDQYWRSGCLDDPNDPWWPPCGEDRFEFTVEGHTLQVFHGNALYNCCLDEIVISAAVEEQLLVLTEEEVAPNPCYCVCCFNAGATINNLPSGEYLVEFWWYDYDTDQMQCYEDQIVVP